MTEYTDRDSLMEALAPLSSAQRAEILYTGNNRQLVVSYGANVTFYHGNLKEGNCWAEKLLGINLSLIERLNAGKPNGIGALGGRTDPEDHEGLSEPLDITKVTLRRELREELAELGIDSEKVAFDDAQLRYLDLPIKDDAYLLAKWKGDLEKGGKVTAVTPYCYSYKFDGDVLAELPRDQAKTADGEVRDFATINLFEALQRFGRLGGVAQSPDGRDLSHDYCYPHEYFTTWKIASDEISGEGKDVKMLRLASEVQTVIYLKGEDYKIDFEKLAKVMSVELFDMDKALNLSVGTVQKMQEAINAISRDDVLSRRP